MQPLDKPIIFNHRFRWCEYSGTQELTTAYHSYQLLHNLTICIEHAELMGNKVYFGQPGAGQVSPQMCEDSHIAELTEPSLRLVVSSCTHFAPCRYRSSTPLFPGILKCCGVPLRLPRCCSNPLYREPLCQQSMAPRVHTILR